MAQIKARKVTRKQPSKARKATRKQHSIRATAEPIGNLAFSIEAVDDQQRASLLLILERKYRSLSHNAQELSMRLDDPNEPRAAIETHLAANGAERALLLSRIDQIESGSSFHFPSAEEISTLRTAISQLETAIAQSAATEALILAGSEVIVNVRAADV